MALTTKNFFFLDENVGINIQRNDGTGKAHLRITRNKDCINEETFDIVLSQELFDSLKLCFEAFPNQKPEFNEEKNETTS